MDIVQVVCEYKIQSAIEDGLFENLPPRGQIDCSLRGESFLMWWFRMHYGAPIGDAHD